LEKFRRDTSTVARKCCQLNSTDNRRHFTTLSVHRCIQHDVLDAARLTVHRRQLRLAKDVAIISLHTQPFYSSLDFVWDNPGELVPEATFRHLLDFLVQNEDTSGRHTNNPDGLPPRPD